MRKTSIVVAVFGLLQLTTVGTAAARECEDVRMADTVTVGGQQLVLNGMGVREATIFNVNVYVAGLYRTARSRNASAILAADEPWRMHLHFVHDVERADIREAFRAGMASAAGARMATFRADLGRLNGWMADMEDGDTMTFEYVPGRGLGVKVKGAFKGIIEGADFARAFLGIWLGQSPPNAGLKTGLLGGSCG